MTDLDQFLRPVNSPITNTVSVSGYEFDSINDRGAVTSMFIQDASITNAKIVNVLADQILAGTITVAVNVGTGTGSVILDGVNNRIIVNDGTANRIVIGNI